ncbi:GTP-binding protein [Streptomyces sp. 4N509B]|uniref:GTP-binding protein n=1 Tax=Streptomyces sp. 4N509B TaxID=3457413 RepID=UPI003FD2A47B
MTGRGAPPPGPLPVVVVAGLHVEARAAAVTRLLRTVPGSVAVHHDVSAAPDGASVRRVLRDAVGELDRAEVPPTGRCGCCAVRRDLPGVLGELAASGRHRMVVVELWESVEPQGIAELIAHGAQQDGGPPVRLTQVVTAVDPALVLACLSNGDDLTDAGLAVSVDDRRVVADTFARQLEYAPVLAVADSSHVSHSSHSSHCSHSPRATEEDRALLRQLHPTAHQVRVEGAELAVAALAGFDASAAAAAQHPACARLPQEAEEAGVATVVWRRRRPFHAGRLDQALERIACSALRSRGRFWLADRPDVLLSWDAAGGAVCVDSVGPWLAALPGAAWEMVPPERRAAAALDWHPHHGDRGQHLVFTGPRVDRADLTELLDSCLLTPAEEAAGPAAWRAASTGFDAWLDSVTDRLP